MTSVYELVLSSQDSDGSPVRDLHYDSGSTIEMLCRVRRPPAYQTRVVWEARYARSPGSVFVLNQDGKILLSTYYCYLWHTGFYRGAARITRFFRSDSRGRQGATRFTLLGSHAFRTGNSDDFCCC